MSVVSLNKSDILSACTDGVTEGNIRAKKVGLYYTERKSSTVAPEIILAVNEELPYVMESGRIPGTSEEDYGKRLVALGRSQYRYAYEENGKHYVTFENETYEVTGIIGNEGSDYSDNMIVFDNRCLGDNVRKSVNELKEYTIMIDSNTTELNDTYEKVYNNVYGADINCAIESRSVSGNGQSTVEKTLQKENIKINKVVYIFCILNCMLMSEFWIIERNKEFAIKRDLWLRAVKINRRNCKGYSYTWCGIACHICSGSSVCSGSSWNKAVYDKLELKAYSVCTVY